MFGFIWNKFQSNPVESDKFSYKPILIIGSVSLLIFSIGYMLKPVSDIVDELNDSKED